MGGKPWRNPSCLLGGQHLPLHAPTVVGGGVRDRSIELDWSVFGTTGGATSEVKEGIYGAPIVDHGGRVAGYFSCLLADDGRPLLAHTRSLDLFVEKGWEVV